MILIVAAKYVGCLWWFSDDNQVPLGCALREG